MRRWSIAAALLVAALLPAVSAGAQAEEPAERGTWIVTLRPGAPSRQHAAGLSRQYGGEVGHVYEHVLNGFSFRGSAAAAAALEQNPNVESVEADKPLRLVGDGVPNGVMRIGMMDAYYAGFRGSTAAGQKIRIAILDTGIQPNHPDLPNVTGGVNCITSGQPPTDGHGHGTHVAGIAAAAVTGAGLVGVAPSASLVPVKVLDDSGNGSDANVICGLDHAASLMIGDDTPTVVNLSLGEGNRPNEGSCDATTTSLHRAICNLTSGTETRKGVTVVAAAGNSGTNAAGFVPAAYPEVIAVSAFTALNGSTSNWGCDTFPDIFYACDETLANFTNYGDVVDVTAPGVEVYSTTRGSSYATLSGTSMASPHVAGAAAVALGANPSLAPADVLALLRRTGECPGVTLPDETGGCAGQWKRAGVFGGTSNDPDGIAEPLVNVHRAALNAGTPPPPADDTTPPTVAIASPTGGAVRGTVTVSASATDSGGVAKVDFYDGAALIGTDTTSPYSVPWATASTADGTHSLTAKAYDTSQNEATSAAVTVTVDNTAPTVSVTAPAAGTVAGTLTIAAEPSDGLTGVASVALRVDGTTVGTATAAPWSAAWDSTKVANGEHTITAFATDGAGNSTTSAGVVVNVQNAAPATVMSIDNLIAVGQWSGRSWATWAQVWVVDQHGAGVGGAAVSFRITAPNGTWVTRQCTTDGAGYCTTEGNKVLVNKKYTNVYWQTTSVTRAGATFDGRHWGVRLYRP